MDENKNWYQSKTVWSGIVVLVAVVLGQLGFTVDAATQGEIVDTLLAIITAVAGIVAIVGRIKATKQIGK